MSKGNRLSRKEMREEAFILTFQTLFNDVTVDEAKEGLKESDDREYCAYAELCAKGIDEKREELDTLISKYLKNNWRIDRISKASHAIMLLAVYEIKYNDSVPNAVAVNEAVELAKKYSPDDAKFINGVLGSYVRDNNG